MLAKVNGVFRLSQDIELRYLSNGSALAKLNLVNSSKYKTQSGEQKEDTCFIEGAIFGKLAEVANQYLKKGSKIYVDADLKQDTWTTNEGQNRSKHTLKINTFEMLDSKPNNQQNGNQSTYTPKNEQQQYTNEYQVPVNNQVNQSEDLDDEIPF